MANQEDQKNMPQVQDIEWRSKVREVVTDPLMIGLTAFATLIGISAVARERPLDEKTRERIEKDAHEEVKRLMQRAEHDPEQRKAFEAWGRMLRGGAYEGQERKVRD